mmetsp:Transcript_42759/g.66992  ORF Transcript_42759/g.66992 Transcript_42759/m.66992 type:complete len:83 (+) Transcript_42759:1567-1815(+)
MNTSLFDQAMAINKFEGGIVLVSHDERLIELCADELWHVERRQGEKPGSLTIFDGSFEEYREMLHKRFESQNLLNTSMARKK